MPKSKFEQIYKDLKEKIESGDYAYQDLLPSENTMVSIYNCSRNTIRRALSELTEQGYVQPLHGKGVRIIYQPIDQAAFTIGGIESFKESAIRNHKKRHTEVIQFAEITADERLAAKTGFPVGSELYYLQRVRFLDGIALILDVNMFLKSLVPNLTKEIAENSIYEYIENDLGMSIVTSKRKMTVERATQIDEKYLQLNDITVWQLSPGRHSMPTELCLNTPSHAIGRIISVSKIPQREKDKPSVSCSFTIKEALRSNLLSV